MQGLKSSKTYSLYDARQLAKPRGGGKTIDSDKPGQLLEIDHTFYSKNNRGLLPKSKNQQYIGAVVVVDVFSGYTDAEPVKSTQQYDTLIAVRKIFKRLKTKMSLTGTLQSDGGVEYRNPNAAGRNLFTEMVNSFGLTYIQVSRKTAVHVEQRNNDLRKNINSRLAASGSKNWVPLLKPMIREINKTVFTDYRQPNSPNELLKLPRKE